MAEARPRTIDFQEGKDAGSQVVDALMGEVDSVVDQWLARDGMIDLRPTFEDYLASLLKLHESFFESQSDPNGKSWQPLSPITIKKKGHGIILVEHGDLAASLTSASHTDNISDIIQEGQNQGFTFGTSDEKAHWHQEGKGHNPQRQHVGTTQESVAQLTNAIADQIVDQLTK